METNSANRPYTEHLVNIRDKLKQLNAKLPARHENKMVTNTRTTPNADDYEGLSRENRQLFAQRSRAQDKASCNSFTCAFSQHSDTKVEGWMCNSDSAPPMSQTNHTLSTTSCEQSLSISRPRPRARTHQDSSLSAFRTRVRREKATFFTITNDKDK